jgi:hypothetical protein
VHDTTSFDGWAIDGDYIHRNFNGARVGSQIIVVEDSDQVFLLGLTPRAEMVPSLKGSWWKAAPVIGPVMRGLILAAAVSDRYVDPLRREIYRIPVRWHGRDISPQWVRVERRARAVIGKYVIDQSRHKAGQLCWRIVNSVLWNASRIRHAGRLCIRALRGDAAARRTFAERVSAVPRRLAHIYLNLIYVCFGEHAYSYKKCLLKALAGDALERERISKRLKKIVHAARLRIVR